MGNETLLGTGVNNQTLVTMKLTCDLPWGRTRLEISLCGQPDRTPVIAYTMCRRYLLIPCATEQKHLKIIVHIKQER